MANTMVEVFKATLKNDDRVRRLAGVDRWEVLFFRQGPVFGRGSQKHKFVPLYTIPQRQLQNGGSNSVEQSHSPPRQMSQQLDGMAWSIESRRLKY